jgi:phosphohistidine phosphatase
MGRREESVTMALYLVQHGLALPKETDPEKGLSERGRAQTQQIAEVAGRYQVGVRRIYHSGKKRARETAAIFESYLKPPEGLRRREGLGPLDDVAPLAGHLDLAADWMLVGHLPFMERLTAYLILGSPAPTIFMFQNSGIVCIDEDPREGKAAIKWALMPNVG